jgi:hypothetical protein
MKHSFLHMETTPHLQQHLRSETKITNGLLVVTRGRAKLTQLYSQTEPYGSKIANETPCHRLQTGRRGLSAHYGNQEYKLIYAPK